MSVFPQTASGEDPPMTNPLATVVRDGDTFELAAGMPVTFGRDQHCTICLDPDDAGISRVAGSVEEQSGRTWLVNQSTTRPFSVRDDLGLPHRVYPGRMYPLAAPVTVLVEGSKGRHVLQVDLAVSPTPSVRIPTGTPTVSGGQVTIRDEDRLALVALFAGYLRVGSGYDPEPRTYEAAASRLGWTPAKVRRRIEYLRERLTDAGIPNLSGANALKSLAEYAITARLITPDDLSRLRT